MRYHLGRRTRRYTSLLGLTPVSTGVMGAYFTVLIIGAFALGNVSYVDDSGVRQPLPTLAMAAYLVVGFGSWIGVFALIRQPKDISVPPLANRIADQVRDMVNLLRGSAAFRRSSESPRPRPVGEILPLSVTDSDDQDPMAVIRHDGLWGSRPSRLTERSAYFSTVFEVEGRGGGLRDDAWEIREDQQVSGLLVDLAGDQLPVRQLEMLTRAMPGLPVEYQRQALDMVSAFLDGTPMGDNALQKLRNLSVTSDTYRTFAVVTMPEFLVSKWSERKRIGTDRDALLQAVRAVTKAVGDRLDRAGFRVIRHLGPRRLGALIRHLYQPLWDIDDLEGIEDIDSGWVDYPQPLPELLAVPDVAHDATWWHATGDISPWGWPAEPVETRWLEPVVTGLFNPENHRSVVRTIATSWQLLSPQESHTEIQQDLLRAKVEQHKNRGRVTTGEDDLQSKDTQEVSADLLKQATGVRVSTRITVSARSIDQALEARDLADSKFRGIGVSGSSGIRWHEGRQDAAMLLTLPLGRGW